MANQEERQVPSEFGDNIETDMKAFYASLDSSEDYFRPSEKTKKAIYFLQGLLSKEFSLLLHPGRSIVMKDTLKYLLTLPPEEGLSIKTKSHIQQLLQSFVQWSLKYHNASKISRTEEAELSKASEGENVLEANVQEFQEMVKKKKTLCKQLANLHEDKTKLEEKINATNAEIVNSTAQIDRVSKRQIELYHKGREVKAKIDDLMMNVARMKAEQEVASNIEAEWLNLREQFIQSTGINRWI